MYDRQKWNRSTLRAVSTSARIPKPKNLQYSPESRWKITRNATCLKAANKISRCCSKSPDLATKSPNRQHWLGRWRGTFLMMSARVPDVSDRDAACQFGSAWGRCCPMLHGCRCAWTLSGELEIPRHERISNKITYRILNLERGRFVWTYRGCLRVEKKVECSNKESHVRCETHIRYETRLKDCR